MKGHEVKISQLIGGQKSLLDKIKNVSRESGIKDHEESSVKRKDQLEMHEKVCRYIDLVMVEEIKVFKE